jgi:hypothetical protein
MKKKTLLLALVPLSLTFVSCAKTSATPLDVIIMGGQSNMVGCSSYSGLADSIGSAKYDEYVTGYKGVKIAFDCWTRNGDEDYQKQNSSNGKFVPSVLGEGNSDLTFGPEIGMAETFSATRNNKVALIKYACGASSLLMDWASPGAGKMTTMYQNFLAYVKAEMKVLTDSGYAPTIKAMCWMQGEADAFPGYAEEYYSNLHYLAKDLRKELLSYSGNQEFAFIDGGISDSTSWPQYQAVNSAKQQFASEADNNIYIDTIGAGLTKDTLQSDNAHYKGASMIKLGKLFAAAVEPFLSAIQS